MLGLLLSTRSWARSSKIDSSMKFGSSFQFPRQSTSEDGNFRPTPFRKGSTRRKKSSLGMNEFTLNARQAPIPELPPTPSEEPFSPPPPVSRRRIAFQDFFRNAFRGSTAKSKKRHLRFPTNQINRKQSNANRVSKVAHSKRNSQHTFDISDEVLDKLVGPPKPNEWGNGKIQSEQFFVRQRMRAESRAATSTIKTHSPAISGCALSLGLGNDSRRSVMYSIGNDSRTSFAPHRGQAAKDRRMLMRDEVDAMFAGAPYFSAPSTKDGGFSTQVEFVGGDIELSRRYVPDHVKVAHSTFEASSLGSQRTKDIAQIPPSTIHVTVPVSAESTLLEMPNMLSANGLDPGTIGFEHYLQLPIADSTRVPDDSEAFYQRPLLLSEPEKLGLRELDLELMIERLSELSEIHDLQKQPETSAWSDQLVEEMGEELFAHLLDSELGNSDAGTGDVSLKTQIAALQTVLSKQQLWYDFSYVEWRLRAGQLLWSDEGTRRSSEERQPCGRDVLLLQVTLAAELMVRLNALKASASPSAEDELKEAKAAATSKLQWDIVFAKTFVEHVRVKAWVKDVSRKSNRISLFSAITFLTARETATDDGAEDKRVQPLLIPKNEEGQLDGLLRFADLLGWPHVEDMRRQLRGRLAGNAEPPETERQLPIPRPSRPISGFSVYATPLSSPLLPGYAPPLPPLPQDSGYFGTSQRPRPGLSRTTTANSVQLLSAAAIRLPSEDEEVAKLDVGGWLSHSWFFGLVMPGEPASHFLVSTLLENSPKAIESLGDAADLYGGFLYAGKGWWSKSCVVGRVMSARKGTRECMGWLSVPNVESPGSRLETGWVNLKVEDAPGSSTAEPRIKSSRALVAKDSDPLHGVHISALQAGDFVTPTDGPSIMGNEVKCLGLSFKPSSSSPASTKRREAAGELPTPNASVAFLTFTSPTSAKAKSIEVPLTYDVHFISSYPCQPTPSAARRSSRASALTATRYTSPQAADAPPCELPGSPVEISHFPVSNPPTPPRGEKRPHTAPSSNASIETFVDARSVIALPPLPTQPPPPPPVPRFPRSVVPQSARASAMTTMTTLSLLDIEKELPPPPAHPLHIEYKYSVIPVASLLSAPPESRPWALSMPGSRGSKATMEDEVVVLDCRGSDDLELLARAWCAKIGESAVIGKVGRTCVACCVREARACGVSIIIRI